MDSKTRKICDAVIKYIDDNNMTDLQKKDFIREMFNKYHGSITSENFTRGGARATMPSGEECPACGGSGRV